MVEITTADIDYISLDDRAADPATAAADSAYLYVKGKTLFLIDADGSVRQFAEVLVGQTAAPTVNEDAGDGYLAGLIWIDETNDDAYICLDTTATAAVWKKITP
jgi:hypothetical protein